MRAITRPDFEDLGDPVIFAVRFIGIAFLYSVMSDEDIFAV
jgi:hypothetical protein